MLKEYKIKHYKNITLSGFKLKLYEYGRTSIVVSEEDGKHIVSIKPKEEAVDNKELLDELASYFGIDLNNWYMNYPSPAKTPVIYYVQPIAEKG